jgi:hypothetical protein
MRFYVFLGGFVFGIVNIVGNFGTVFCDQAYWQSSVAAKPLQAYFFNPSSMAPRVELNMQTFHGILPKSLKGAFY